MKLKTIISFAILLLTLVLHSCYDEKMKWGDPYTHPAAKDLPLSLAEAISRYDVLTAYTNFKLGAGIDFGMYSSNEAYRDIVNKNFKEITPGNEMKQNSLMNAKGVIDFSKADAGIAKVKASGLSVYGHNLVWHSQQQATYLNSLIAPTVVPGTPGSSLVDGSFENGMAGWTPPYYAENFSIISGDAVDGTKALQVIIPSDATGGKYDGHGFLNSPDFPIITGHHYQISLWVKGSAPGQIAIDFPDKNLGNQYPWVNGAEYAPVTTSWTQVIYNTTTSGDPAFIATADGNTHVRFLLASMPNVTYLIDAIEITDLDAAPTEYNYVDNGNFETGDLTGWTAVNNAGGISVSAAAAYSGSFGLQAVTTATSANEWDTQLQTTAIQLDPNKTYTMSFVIKSDIDGTGRISFPGFSNEWPWTNWDGSGAKALFTTSNSWKPISFDFTPVYKDGVNAVKFSFDLGKFPGVTYFVDDVKVVEKAATTQSSKNMMRSGPITIDKTPEEKAAILNAVLIHYIDTVATHFKGQVAAWDVVNEPMDETGAVRAGLEDLTATDVFYWSYYLGKDYAVTAFKTARAADPGAKLFINDYNLEYSVDKLNGIIEYVKYIDTKAGATVVDGIGTQLHISLSTDTTAIAAMFTKLAATGKMIKVSEMDVALGTASPTLDQQTAQANIYRFVARKYTEIIPVAQQYGITIWGVSDNPDEHVYWLPNNSPNLWDANYVRKVAYKGFADGLAGKDVSADFSGELQY